MIAYMHIDVIITISCIQNVQKYGGEFMQDKTRLQNVANTMNYLQHHGIQFMDWPLLSPDLKIFGICKKWSDWSRFTSMTHKCTKRRMG